MEESPAAQIDSPIVKKLANVIETLFKSEIHWLYRGDEFVSEELGSRIEKDGAPCIAYGRNSKFNDLSLSHELLHLWRFACGVPILNVTPINRPSFEGLLADVQNHFEHLWIYNIQGRPPFNLRPWNKPYPRKHIKECIREVTNNPQADLSWGAAMDSALSRPTTSQEFLRMIKKTHPLQAQKAKILLKEWTFTNIDSPMGAGKTLLRILGGIGFDLNGVGVKWQVYDKSFQFNIVPIGSRCPTFSCRKFLISALEGDCDLEAINHQRDQ